MIARLAVLWMASMLVLPALAGEPAKTIPLLQSSKTADGAPIAYPRTDKPEITVMIVEVPAGGEVPWHTHPVPTVAYVLSGELDVPTEGEATRHYKAGDAFLEVVDRVHMGINHGTVPVRILVVYVGEQGMANSKPAQQ